MMVPAWERFKREARLRYERGDFDRLFLTQIYPDNFGNYDGTVRTSIFRSYPGPITVPVTPVIRLATAEVEASKEFAERHRLGSYRNVILFECSAGSGQSFVTPDFALQTARGIVARQPNTAVILSSHLAVDSGDPRIIDGSTLPFKGNAELAKSCTLLIGCSSGISWLTTS